MGRRRNIVTDRLVLKQSVDERDLTIYKSHLMECDPEEFYFQYGEERSEEFMELIDFHSSPVKYYTIFLKETKEMVGYVGLNPHGRKCCELEFHVFGEFRRNHYAHEACSAVLKEFWDGRLLKSCGRCVIAETITKNKICCSFLESLGFTKEAQGMRITLTSEGEFENGLGLTRYELAA